MTTERENACFDCGLGTVVRKVHREKPLEKVWDAEVQRRVVGDGLRKETRSGSLISSSRA